MISSMHIKINLFLIIFLLPIFAASPQDYESSLLYNDRGQFRPDTSLSISMDQWKIWKETEIKIYDVCGHGLLAYNLATEIEENKFRKRNIISFQCDSTGISDIKYVIKHRKTWDGDKSTEDLYQVKRYRKDIFKYFNEANKDFYNDSLNIYGTYYISL